MAKVPKIIGASLREHREQVQSRLFDALAELIGEEGFDAVTLSQVAARAGVGRTAVYNHFDDKEAMLLGLTMHETNKWARALELALDGVTDPVERLRVYMRQRLVLKPEYQFAPDLRRVLSAKTQAKMRDHVVLVEGILRDILADGIAQGAFEDHDLDLTVALVMSCLSGRVVGRGRYKDL